MRAAVLLLCLTLVVPVAQAADWLAWRKVGDATLTWGPFTVYTSSCVRRTGVTVGRTRIRR